MPLLCVWLNTVHDAVKRAEHEPIEDTEDEDPLDVLRIEMLTMMSVFHSRMLELGRVWRQQRMSVSAQVESFCGGIFRTWYEKVSHTDVISKRKS